MNTEQKDVYTTAKEMGLTQPYACGWYNHPDCGFGWQVVRMRDNAILYQSGEGVTEEQLKAHLFDLGINKYVGGAKKPAPNRNGLLLCAGRVRCTLSDCYGVCMCCQ